MTTIPRYTENQNTSVQLLYYICSIAGIVLPIISAIASYLRKDRVALIISIMIAVIGIITLYTGTTLDHAFQNDISQVQSNLSAWEATSTALESQIANSSSSVAQAKVQALQNELNYSDVAQLNWDGLTYNVNYGDGLKYETSLSDTVGNYVYLSSSSQIIYTCSPSSTAAFQKLIDINSKFPYGYYYLGECQNLLGFPSSTWLSTMKAAYNILSITTQIPNHDPTQDTLYKYFQTLY